MSGKNSVEAINRRVDELKASTEASIAQRRLELDEANRHIRQLTTEGNRRHTGVSAQVSRLIGDVKRLETLLGQLTEQVAGIKPSANPFIAQGNLDDFESIKNRLEQFDGFISTIRTLEVSVKDLQATANAHGERISNVEDGHEQLKEKHQKLTHRVYTVEQLLKQFRDKTPWGRVVIAAVAGLIAGFVWSNTEFTQNWTLADGTVQAVPLDVANSGWAALAAGVAAFGFALGLLLLFVKAKSGDTITPVEADRPYRTERPSTNVANSNAEGATPTTVLVTEGAASGTR